LFWRYLGGSATILAVSKKALSAFLQILTIPTPLWATISLVLLSCLYIYLKFRPSQSGPSYKIAYFTVGNFKWKTKIYRPDYFEVDQYPLCKKHDLPFIFHPHYIHCPEHSCGNRIDDADRRTVYAAAKSYIDKEIRDGNY
jgi:hypothetical protein